jgi:hypothetical protein
MGLNIFDTNIKKVHKCQYLEICQNVTVPIDYHCKIHFYCLKHHCKYLKSRYNEFKEEDIEVMRQLLQPRLDLLSYQMIMSKVRFII